jgi:hypothetical protein
LVEGYHEKLEENFVFPTLEKAGKLVETLPGLPRPLQRARARQARRQVEEQEHQLLGGGGFEGSLKDVRDLEAALGIGDLAAFTPQ